MYGEDKIQAGFQPQEHAEQGGQGVGAGGGYAEQAQGVHDHERIS